MRSTEGIYYSRLDHVRALAAYLVFCWHFLHLTPTFPVPYASAPVFPLALLDEGHTGVALFMTLSGYLFAKLVGDRGIDFPAFLWSRAVRLGPLLIVCIAAWVLIGRIGAVSAISGGTANLDSITAVVIGGTSLFGGRGSIVGTLFGALIVGVFRNGLALAGADVVWQEFTVGLLIILAVSIDQWIRRVSA